MNIYLFEQSKEEARTEIGNKIDELVNNSIFFVDEKLTINNNLPTTPESIFDSINRILDFNLMYPTLYGYYQLIKYLFLGSLLDDAYRLLKVTTLMEYCYNDKINANYESYKRYHNLGFIYEHMLYILSDSSNVSEYLERTEDIVIPNIVNLNIPYECYLNEIDNMQIDYFFTNESLELIDELISGTLRNDVTFVKSYLFDILPGKNLLEQYTEKNEYIKGIENEYKVVKVRVNEQLGIEGLVLGNVQPVYECCIDMVDNDIEDFSCQCLAYAKKPYKLCKHLVSLYLRFVSIIRTYYQLAK